MFPFVVQNRESTSKLWCCLKYSNLAGHVPPQERLFMYVGVVVKLPCTRCAGSLVSCARMTRFSIKRAIHLSSFSSRINTQSRVIPLMLAWRRTFGICAIRETPWKGHVEQTKTLFPKILSWSDQDQEQRSFFLLFCFASTTSSQELGSRKWPLRIKVKNAALASTSAAVDELGKAATHGPTRRSAVRVATKKCIHTRKLRCKWAKTRTIRRKFIRNRCARNAGSSDGFVAREEVMAAGKCDSVDTTNDEAGRIGKRILLEPSEHPPSGLWSCQTIQMNSVREFCGLFVLTSKWKRTLFVSSMFLWLFCVLAFSFFLSFFLFFTDCAWRWTTSRETLSGAKLCVQR